MSARNHLPDTVNASLDARLSPYHREEPTAARACLVEDLDAGSSRAVSPRRDDGPRVGLVNDLKLLFRALGAGNSVVPLGDNSRAARLLAEYARSLRAS